MGSTTMRRAEVERGRARAGRVRLIAPLLLGLSAAPAAAQVADWATRIGPIVTAACVSCHRRDGPAPFSLETYEQVRQRGQLVADVVRRRVMPPWKPDVGHGDFEGARRLAAEEIVAIERWVAGGMPRGDDRTPAGRSPVASPDVARPTLVLSLPPFTLRAEGPDVFRNFVVSVPIERTQYVRALEFRPGHAAVHHANIRVDRTPNSREIDARDPLPGYEGAISRTADFPDGHFVGWTPGQVSALPSDDLSWPLSPGSDLVIQMHMRPTGAAELITPTIALHLGDRAPAFRPSMIRLGRQGLDIAPNEVDYLVSDAFVLPVDAQVRAVQPHAHSRARRVRAWAELPNGSSHTLIRISDWDPAWQDRYLYSTPFWLPAGTRLVAEYTFDNSSDNPRNPAPGQRATWGWRSSDEMADVWLQVMTRSDADGLQLRAAAERHMLVEDAIGSEVLLSREPDHVLLLNDAAAIYMKLGRPRDALRHFARVTKRTPSWSISWYNEGVALEALGQLDEAGDRYTRALEIDAAYSAAHNNLGAVRLKQGRVSDARLHFSRALTGNPDNVEARANLALVLIDTGDPDRAIVEMNAVLALQPQRLLQALPFVWLLAAHPDAAVRRPAAAARLASQIAAQVPQSVEALDALAACQAAQGRFDEAWRTATDALRWARSDDARREIELRRTLYRAKQAFVIAR